MLNPTKEAVAKYGIVRPFTDPALSALAEARRAYLVWRDWAATDDDKEKAFKAACRADSAAWWKMVDTTPATVTGAVEVARFMLEREAVEDAPNIRKGSKVELNIAALAAAKVLPFFGAPEADPAIAAVRRLQAARDAWAEFPDDRMEDAEFEALQDQFNEAREVLSNTLPTSPIGAGLMASEIQWCVVCGTMDERDMRAVLLNIASAFAPAEEKAGGPALVHAIAAE